jgi:hypothetical protein
MPEVIQLEGSPADLLGNAAQEDDAGSEPEAAQEDDNDDAASAVTIHTPEQLSPEGKEERRQLIR